MLDKFPRSFLVYDEPRPAPTGDILLQIDALSQVATGFHATVPPTGEKLRELLDEMVTGERRAEAARLDLMRRERAALIRLMAVYGDDRDAVDAWYEWALDASRLTVDALAWALERAAGMAERGEAPPTCKGDA